MSIIEHIHGLRERCIREKSEEIVSTITTRTRSRDLGLRPAMLQPLSYGLAVIPERFLFEIHCSPRMQEGFCVQGDSISGGPYR